MSGLGTLLHFIKGIILKNVEKEIHQLFVLDLGKR